MNLRWVTFSFGVLTWILEAFGDEMGCCLLCRVDEDGETIAVDAICLMRSGLELRESALRV
jgi:hypothetical protein